jgi:N-acetylmuramoyl-L-alanine amidase
VTAFVPDSPRVKSVVAAVNCEPRRGVGQPDMLVLHYTGMQTAAKAIQWLACAESRVSCHYVVDETGDITQLVPEHLRAWHAGVSAWFGETDLNSASIGIEIHNPGHDDGYWEFPKLQIDAVIALSQDILRRHVIASSRVLAHSDIAPFRKIDPGEKFPWPTLHAAGIGAWVPPSPVQLTDPGLGPDAAGGHVLALQKQFARYGYDMPLTGAYDRQTVQVVQAFQRHFRPARCDGRLDLSTLATLERLQALTSAPLRLA